MTDAQRRIILMRANVTEEELMNYADGLVPFPRRAEITDALIKHPDMLHLLESYLFTRLRLAQVYHERVPDPDPDRYFGASSKPTERKPVAQPRKRLFGLGRPATPLRTSMMAAAATLAVVAFGGWLALRDFAAPDKQGVAAFPSLQKALETTASFQSAELEKQVTFKARMTFFSQRLGRWCREFDVTYGASVLQPGQVACRDDQGTWRVRYISPTDVVDAKTQPIEPAQGETAKVLEDLEATSFVEPEKERPIIGNGWQLRP